MIRQWGSCRKVSGTSDMLAECDSGRGNQVRSRTRHDCWTGSRREDEGGRRPMSDPERVMRRGVRLGVDVGTVRIGVASCDRDGLLATPVETVKAEPRRASLDRLAALATEYEAFEVIVGLP